MQAADREDVSSPPEGRQAGAPSARRAAVWGNVIIGIVKEIKHNGNRVDVTPAGVCAFTRHGHTALLENGAGVGGGFSDEDYGLPYALALADEGVVQAVKDDSALARGVDICKGKLACEMVAESLKMACPPLADVL